RTATAPKTEASANPSAKPRGEERLDVLAAPGALEARGHSALVDDEGRDTFDVELLEEIGPLLALDAVDAERAVVAPMLQDLSEEALHAPAVARPAGVEKDETRRARLGLQRGGRPLQGPHEAALEEGGFAARHIRTSV